MTLTKEERKARQAAARDMLRGTPLRPEGIYTLVTYNAESGWQETEYPGFDEVDIAFNDLDMTTVSYAKYRNPEGYDLAFTGTNPELNEEIEKAAKLGEKLGLKYAVISMKGVTEDAHLDKVLSQGPLTRVKSRSFPLIVLEGEVTLRKLILAIDEELVKLVEKHGGYDHIFIETAGTRVVDDVPTIDVFMGS